MDNITTSQTGFKNLDNLYNIHVQHHKSIENLDNLNNIHNITICVASQYAHHNTHIIGVKFEQLA